MLRQANFETIGTVAPSDRLRAVDGILFDLGLSSTPARRRDRGFSFRAEGPLDMRFDAAAGVPASELIADARRGAR